MKKIFFSTIILLSYSILYSASVAPETSLWLDKQEALEKIKDTGDRKFLMTLQRGVRNFPFSDKKIFGYTCGFPLIGHYNPEQYKFFTNEVMIKMNPAMFCRGAPERLKQALLSAQKVDSCQNLINRKNIDFYVIIAKPTYFEEFPHYNMVFHPVASQWLSKYGDFNTKINMGLFDLFGGISTIDIALDKFSQQSVNPHGGHFSPDNAKFKLEKDPFATFWACAYHENNIIVIFYTIATNYDSGSLIESYIAGSFSIEELINRLKDIGNHVLFHAADTIKNCIGETDQELEDALRRSREEEAETARRKAKEELERIEKELEQMDIEDKIAHKKRDIDREMKRLEEEERNRRRLEEQKQREEEIARKRQEKEKLNKKLAKEKQKESERQEEEQLSRALRESLETAAIEDLYRQLNQITSNFSKLQKKL